MAFDFKRAHKDLYQPSAKPHVIEVPAMTYVSVRGQGDPNEKGGAYQHAVEVLYALAYTIKMSKMGVRPIEGYFDFVVPPLEGFWWQPGVAGIDAAHKASFEWVSAIRLPDFVTPDDFAWAQAEATRKKKIDTSRAELLRMEEGLCVQAMHVGPYDDEPQTVALMDAFIADAGYENDLSDTPDGRHHHEIYLSDPRRSDPAKLKTVVRHPVRLRPSTAR